MVEEVCLQRQLIERHLPRGVERLGHPYGDGHVGQAGGVLGVLVGPAEQSLRASSAHAVRLVLVGPTQPTYLIRRRRLARLAAPEHGVWLDADRVVLHPRAEDGEKSLAIGIRPRRLALTVEIGAQV